MKNSLRHIRNVSSEALFNFNEDTVDVETSGNPGIGHRGDSIIVIMGNKGQTLIELDLSTLLDENDSVTCNLGALGSVYIKRIINGGFEKQES